MDWEEELFFRGCTEEELYYWVALKIVFDEATDEIWQIGLQLFGNDEHQLRSRCFRAVAIRLAKR